MPNVALDILVNVVRTKILLIFISLLSLVFIFVLVLVASTIIQNVFVIFVIVFVVVDEKNTALHMAPSSLTTELHRQVLRVTTIIAIIIIIIIMWKNCFNPRASERRQTKV